MKKLFTLIIFCVFSSSLSAQVNWESDVNQALAKAKSSGKILFVEAYLPTCPVCQSIEPIFLDQVVSKFYNNEFINYKMDVSKNDGPRKFLDERRIYLPSFPQFLFFDGNGDLIHQGEASADVSSILAVGNEAKVPLSRSSNYKARFESGDRDFNFLIKYGVYAKVTSDAEASKKVGDALYKSFEEQNKVGEDISWSVTQKVITDANNGFFKYWIENIPKAAEISKRQGHPGQEMNTLGSIVQGTLLGKDIETFNWDQLQKMRYNTGKVGAAQYADTYLWRHEVRAKIEEGKNDEALAIGSKMATAFKDNPAFLIYITRVFNDIYPSSDYTAKAHSWLNISKAGLKENAYLAEYHYELARLSNKENKPEVAKSNGAEALKYAKLANVDLKKFEELQSSFK